MAVGNLKYLLKFFILNLILLSAVSQELEENEKPVEFMTTEEPIDEIGENGTDDSKCSQIYDCEECEQNNCTWTLCTHSEFSCSLKPQEFCPEVPCNTTISTSTELPTTLIPNITTTAEPTTTNAPETTTVPDSTTTSPKTTTSSTTPTSTTPNATTTSSTTSAPSSTTEVPHTRHFDSASFFGGIILALTLTAISFAGWKFYRKRSLATSYTNF